MPPISSFLIWNPFIYWHSCQLFAQSKIDEAQFPCILKTSQIATFLFFCREYHAILTYGRGYDKLALPITLYFTGKSGGEHMREKCETNNKPSKMKLYILLVVAFIAVGIIVPIVASTGYGPGAQPVVPPFVPPPVVAGGVSLPAVRLRARINSIDFTTAADFALDAASIISRTPRNRGLFISVANPTTLDAAHLHQLFEQAANENIHLTINVDTVNNAGMVLMRVFHTALTIAHLSDDVNLRGQYSGVDVTDLRNYVNLYFRNTFTAVTVGEPGSFGVVTSYNSAGLQEYEYVHMRVAVHESLLHTTNYQNLRIYAIDTTNGHYAYIDTYRQMDANGYLHFYTPVGGGIIFTDTPLARR